MKGLGARSLIRLAVTAAMMAATPAGAEMYTRTGPDGTSYFTNVQPNPAYQRVAFIPAATRESVRPSRGDHGAYAWEIAEAAARYNVPERLIWAVIRAESGFDHRAVSRKGARGLMQLMPETAAILGVRDSFNPRQNIDAGVRHLRGLIDRFRNNLRLAIAAYNAGEKAVAAFGGVPPYPETREYVTRVLRFYDTPSERAPIERVQLQANGMLQIIEPDGTVIYTNVPLQRLSAVSQER